MAYFLPQVVINQLFSEVPLNTIQNQNVLVFGPNYQFFDYGDATVRPSIYLGRHDGKGVRLDGEYIGTYRDGAPFDPEKPGHEPVYFDYPSKPIGTDVDADSAKLYAENVRIMLTHNLEDPNDREPSESNKPLGFTKLIDDEDGIDVDGADLDGRMKLPFSIYGEHRDSRFKRSINVGDVIGIKLRSGGYFYSNIIELFRSDADDKDKWDCVRIADTIPVDDIAGSDSAVEDSNDHSIAYPDSIVVFVTDLDGIEIPNKGLVTYQSPRVGYYQWRAEGDKFVLTRDPDESLVITYPAWDGEPAQDEDPVFHQVISADLYIQYRAMLLGATDTLHSIEKSTDVSTLIGDVRPENPLAYGVSMCAKNSADRIVYYMATKGNSAADYDRVLDAATKTDKVYILCPLTQDPEILSNIQSHVDEMSTGTNKLWRIAFINHEVPESKTLYTKADSTDGEGFFATITRDERTMSAPVIVQILEGKNTAKCSTATKCTQQVVPGDTLLVYDAAHNDPWNPTATIPYEYKIKKVTSNHSLVLVDPAVGEARKEYKTPPVRIEVRHDYTYQEKTQAIASASRRYMDRRVYNVFPTWARDEAGRTIPGHFIAAAVSGLVSSVLPQQPITNVEISGISDVPIVYNEYSRTQLNEIAEGGTFIIMQDLPGDRVYVRHQISTEYGSNNLLKAELSITKNLDSISYYFAEAYRPYIGRYNITPELLLVLRAVAEKALSRLETNTGSGLLGPQVLAEGTEITDLYQDPVNQDHVYMHLKLNLPRPFNVLDLDLEVI